MVLVSATCSDIRKRLKGEWPWPVTAEASVLWAGHCTAMSHDLARSLPSWDDKPHGVWKFSLLHSFCDRVSFLLLHGGSQQMFTCLEVSLRKVDRAPRGAVAPMT